MGPYLIPGLLIGATVGVILGYLKFRSPVAGAVLGACVGVAVGHFVGIGPSPVGAVETVDEFESQVLSSPRPVLVDFYSDRCGPCRRLAPTIEKLAKEYQGRVRVVKINVMKTPELAHHYNIRAIPNVMIFVHGKPVTTILGDRPASHYRMALDAALP